jgi:hypothetical protein
VSPTQTTTYTVTTGPTYLRNLVYNGDFSQTNLGFTSEATYLNPTNPSNTNKTFGVVTNSSTWSTVLSNCSAVGGTGKMLVYKGSNTAAVSTKVWKQVIPVVAGQNYDFSYLVQSLNYVANAAMIDVTINGITVNSTNAPTSNCSWQSRNFTWNSGAATTAEICIVDRVTGVGTQNNAFAIDNIKFETITNCLFTDSVTVYILTSTPSSNQLSVEVTTNSVICNENECTDFTATYPDLKYTNDYVVQPKTYEPYPFNGGTILPTTNSSGLNDDDFWSTTIVMPFKFCFYGNSYTNFILGTNGVISFEQSTATQTPDGFCQWAIGQNIPSTGNPINSIFGVFQDIHYASRPSDAYINYYSLGTAPNRVMVVNYFKIPQFPAQASNLQTYQIVLHETTNIIEVNIERRVPNNGWNNGRGIIGIQNATATQFKVAPGRNALDPTWSATNESWQFVPSGTGPSLVNFHWEDSTNPGVVYSTANPLNVCVEDKNIPETYVAVVEYTSACDPNSVVRITDSATAEVNPALPVTDPVDICYNGTLPATINIDQTNSILTPIQVPDFLLTYFTNPADAETGNPASQIPNEFAYNATSLPITIYVRIEDTASSGCFNVRPFDIVNAPSGTFNYDATYCNSIVADQLPVTTNLTTGGTYSAVPIPPSSPTNVLIIDPNTGAITPNGSGVGKYTVSYDIPLTATCPAFHFEFDVEILSCGCSVSAINNGPICQGSSVDLDVTTPVPGGTYTWTGPDSYNSGPLASPLVTITPISTGNLTYNLSVTSPTGNCSSSTVVVVNSTPAVPSVTNPAPYCVADTATQLTATGANLLWYANATGGTGNTTAPTPSTTIAGTTNYYVSQTVSGCESTRALITVTVNAIPAAPTVTNPAPYCQNDTATSLTATGTNLLWYSSLTDLIGDTAAPTPSTATVGNENFYVSQTVNGCESTRALITVNTKAIPAAPTVTNPAPYCVGNTASVLTATGTGLLWYANATGGTGTATAPTPSTTVAGVFNFYVTQTINACESPRALITVTVNAIPAAPAVTNPAPYCVGTTATQLTATGANLLWYANATGGTGNTTAPTPSTTIAGTTNYYVSQTVSGCESPRALITVTVNAIPTAPIVTNPAPYCQNDTATSLTANGTNLLWYSSLTDLIGDTAAPTPSTATVGNENFYVSQTVNGCESTRALITVNTKAIPAAPTVTNPAPYCVADTATQLTATGTGLLWYANATGGTGTATAPTPSTTVAGVFNFYVTQTINACESPRALITVTVNAIPAAPAVTNPAPYCVGTTATQLTATGANLLWYANATGGTGNTTAPTPSTTIAGTTNYYVSQTVSGCESPRALITVTVNAIPTAPIVTNPAPYCQNDTATSLTANGTNLLWYSSLTDLIGDTAAPTPSTATVGNENFYVSQTVNGCESTRALITVNTKAIPAAPTVTNPAPYCVGNTASVLTATGTGLLWYANATGGTGNGSAPTPSTTVAGVFNFYVTQTINACESPRALITVTVNAIPAAPAVTNPAPYCVGTTATQLTATGANLLWYANATGGTGNTTAPTPSTTIAGTTNYYVSQTVSGCESPRALITVTVNAIPAAPTVTNPAPYCQNDTATSLTANGTNLLWYSSLTDLIGDTAAPTPSTATVGNENFYVSQTVNGCESTRALITVNTKAIPAAPTVTNPAPYCVGNTASVLTATGTGLLWYANATGGTGTATAPTPSTTVAGVFNFYVTQTINACESPRALITVTVNAIPAAPAVTNPAPYCVGTTATQLTATGANLLWYANATGGTGNTTAPTPSTTIAGTTNYYVSQTVSGCESPRALITVTVNAIPTAPIVTNPAPYCQNDTATSLTANGTNLLWYSSLTDLIGDTAAPTPSTATVGNENFYVSQTVNGCESTRALITVNTKAIPAAPTVTNPAPYCVADTATQLTATGTGLLWYANATGGTGTATAPTPSTTVAGVFNFYVTQTINACESPRALITVTVNAIPAAPAVTNPAPYCVGTTATQLTATGANLLWYANATGGTGNTTAPTPSTTLAGTTNYYVSQTVSGCESPRALITVTVNAIPTAPIVTNPAPYCQNDTATSLTANGTNLLWYSSLTDLIGDTAAPTPSTATVGNENFYVSQTVNGCESTRALITVTTKAIPAAPTVTNPAPYCVADTATQLTATGTGLLWYANATGGTGTATAPTPSTTVAGVFNFYVTQTINACESPRALITVTVNAIPAAPAVTNPAPYCVGTTATQLTATGANLLWYANATGGTGNTTAPTPSTTLAGTTNYYVSQTVSGCESPRALITVTVNAIPNLVVTNPAATCNTTVDLTDSSVTTGSDVGVLSYWTNSNLTTAVTTPTSVSQSGVYYIELTVNGCSTSKTCYGYYKSITCYRLTF